MRAGVQVLLNQAERLMDRTQHDLRRGAVKQAQLAEIVVLRDQDEKKVPGFHGTTLSRSAFFDAKEVVAESPAC